MERKLNLVGACSIAALVAGVVWSALFPKKASFDSDMVASVALGAGLIATGLLLRWRERMGTALTVVSLVALWSLLANAWLLAEVEDCTQILLEWSRR